MTSDHSSARPGAGDAGTENAHNFPGSGRSLTQPDGERKAAPKLTFTLNRSGPHRLWVQIAGLPLSYAADIHELDTPVDLILRIWLDALKDANFLRQYSPVLEKFLIYTPAEWAGEVDEALAAIGMEAVEP